MGTPLGKRDLVDLWEEVRRLTDRREVADLLLRLVACLDERRFADLRDLFAEDVTVRTPGGEAAGPDAVIEQAARNHESAAAVQHLVGEVLVELDGDEAALRADAFITFVEAADEVAQELREVYRCRAQRTAKGWRLVRVQTSIAARVRTPSVAHVSD